MDRDGGVVVVLRFSIPSGVLVGSQATVAPLVSHLFDSHHSLPRSVTRNVGLQCVWGESVAPRIWTRVVAENVK